jgi:hypothetical protein
LAPKNPKAAGEATVSTLSWPRLAKNFAPSAKRRKSAVLTWNDPLTSRLAFGPNMTPLGLSRYRLAPVISERSTPSMEDGCPPVTRLRIFAIVWGLVKVAVSPVPTLNRSKL